MGFWAKNGWLRKKSREMMERFTFLFRTAKQLKNHMYWEQFLQTILMWEDTFPSNQVRNRFERWNWLMRFWCHDYRNSAYSDITVWILRGVAFWRITFDRGRWTLFTGWWSELRKNILERNRMHTGTVTCRQAARLILTEFLMCFPNILIPKWPKMVVWRW